MKIVTYSIKNLTEERIAAGLNDYELSKLIPNINASHLGKMQSGKVKHPRIITIRKIGLALGVAFVMGHPDGDIYMFSSDVVKELRIMQGLSRRIVSEESGCGYQCIRKIDTKMVNSNYVNTQTVKKIGDTLGVRFY